MIFDMATIVSKLWIQNSFQIEMLQQKVRNYVNQHVNFAFQIHCIFFVRKEKTIQIKFLGNSIVYDKCVVLQSKNDWKASVA